MLQKPDRAGYTRYHHWTACRGRCNSGQRDSSKFWRRSGENGLILKLDLSSNFVEGLLNMGTAGEYLTMGAVVNSFLDTYQADGIEITAGGNVIETGHTSFEGVLNHFDSNESQ